MTVERTDPPRIGGEREMLEGWLEYHRATLLRKCSGLTDAQMRQASCPPSNLTLLGLVRHMTDVERGWFRRGVGGEDVAFRLDYDANPEADFEDLEGADVAEALAAYREECELARAALNAAPLLDVMIPEGRREISVRWVLLHMIEEYARHNGHADLLREAIDGATGD